MITEFIKNSGLRKRKCTVEEMFVQQPDDIGVKTAEIPNARDVLFIHKLKLK
jgi:hypothetical protein